MKTRLDRQEYLRVLEAGLTAGAYGYVRQAAQHWLGHFPGDLAVSLLYGKALLGEKRFAQAAPVLQGLLRADPAYVGAVDGLLALAAATGQEDPFAQAWRAALTGTGEAAEMPAWSRLVGEARRRLDQVEAAGEEQRIEQILQHTSWFLAAYRSEVEQPLAAALHLQWLALQGAALGEDTDGMAAEIAVAAKYHHRWPDCLPVMLWLGRWLAEGEQSDEGVALLHQAAVRDLGAQVAHRLWGCVHPYTALWSDEVSLGLPAMPPAAVAAVLGWNRLEAGRTFDAAATEAPVQAAALDHPAPPAGAAPGREDAQAAGLGARSPIEQPTPPAGGGGMPGDWATQPAALPRAPRPAPAMTEPLKGDELVEIAPGLAPGLLDGATQVGARGRRIWSSTPPQPEAGKIPGGAPDCAPTGGGGITPASSAGSAQPAHAGSAPGRLAAASHQSKADVAGLPGPSANDAHQGEGFPPPARRIAPPKGLPPKPADPDLRAAAAEINRLARKFKQLPIGDMDGRYPIYVVFSLHGKLVEVYGEEAAKVESAMAGLVQAVACLPRWGARLVLADDAQSLRPLGLTPVRSGDPWDIKLFLRDLDLALGGHGERLGALLIVGGPEIVPFHHLPNPTDDLDVDVASDNPYAANDENYFSPEWPVGRLPGGAGKDPHLLVESLERIRLSHARPTRPQGWRLRLAAWLKQAWRRRGAQRRGPHALGYSAAIWKRSAELVYAEMPEKQRLLVSPPLGVGEGQTDGPLNHTPPMQGRLAYFNLHGVMNKAEWYGHRHPQEGRDAPENPVALRPQDLDTVDAHNERPQIIFSEACFGLSIENRTPDDAIALRFLQNGALAVVGATCTAYGSVEPPLAAADLLGQLFWRGLREGQPVGEALRRAKLLYNVEMTGRQGFLDGEDQKTLIAFVLYGDPLASLEWNRPLPKSVRYTERPLAPLRIVNDCPPAAGPGAPLPPEVAAEVKRVTARYLPGMQDARLTYTGARPICGGAETDPVSAAARDGKPGKHKKNGRSDAAETQAANAPSLVTLRRQIDSAGSLHPCIARLTVNEKGKVVKMVVSR